MNLINYSKTTIGQIVFPQQVQLIRSAFAILLFLLSVSSGLAQTNSIFGYINSSNQIAYKINAITKGDNNHLYASLMKDSTGVSILLKADPNGNIIWQKEFLVGTGGNPVNMCQVNYHNNYIYVLATAQSPDTYYTLSKVDVNGSLIWSKNITPVDIGMYHKPSMDIGTTNDIIVASSTFTQFEIFSINENGTTNWIRSCSTDSNEGKNPNFDITTCDNGDIMGCCKSESDMCFYRMSNTGTPVWSKRILEMNNAYTHIKSIEEIGPNLFVACGYRYSTFMSGFYALLDGSGNFINFNMVSGTMEIQNIFPLDNGHFLLKGYTSMGGFSFIEINNSGTIINEHATSNFMGYYPASYEGVAQINGSLFIGDGNHIQKLNTIATTECFEYITTTSTVTGEDPGASPVAPYFIQHPITGTVVDNNEANLPPAPAQLVHSCALTTGIGDPLVTNVAVHPTLLNNSETMFVEHEMTNEVQYSIMDMNGKLVEKNVLSNSSIPVNGVSTGMYILQLTNHGNVVYYSKFVVK